MSETIDLPVAKKPTIDRQLTGLAGELFVGGELAKRGLQTSLTFGNAKAIDLFAYHPGTGVTFTVQVKSLRSDNWFLINPDKIEASHTFVFVLLNAPGQPVRYFIVPGQHLVHEREKFGKGLFDPNMPGVQPKTLRALGYEDAWGAVFGDAIGISSTAA